MATVPLKDLLEGKEYTIVGNETSPEYKKSSLNPIVDVGIGMAKEAGSTIKGLGDTVAGAAPLFAGPFGTIPGVRNAIGNAAESAKNTIQGAVGLTDENLKATNTAQKIGKGLGFAAELATPFVGEKIAASAKAAGSIGKGTVKGVGEFAMEHLPGVRKLFPGKGDESAIKYALDLTAPKVTSKVAAQGIEKGQLVEPGLLSKGRLAPTNTDNLVAESVADVVHPRQSVSESVDAIHQKISQTNLGAREMIASRKTPFDESQLRTRLEAAKKDSELIFASDATAEKTYNAVIKEFLKHVQNKDTLGLFDARQNFDQVPAIRKLLENERLGENVKRQIVLDVRRAANEYIAEQLPVNNPYRSTMMQESRMIEAIGNISDRNAQMVGMNQLQLLAKEYPILRWIAGSIGLGAGVGAGGALIQSTD